MADWLLNGLTATISGVVTVFVVLIIIALIISLLKYVNKLGYKGAPRRAEVDVVPVEQAKEPVREEEDEALVAAIIAAIAAGMDVSTDRLVVRSIRQVHDTRKSWRQRG